MRWKLDWFAYEVSRALELHMEYMAKMEEQLADAQRKASDKLRSAGLDWEEFGTEEQVYEDVYLREFPKDLRYSFVVLICILLETRLTAACDEIQSRKHLALKANEFRGDAFDQAKRFLKKVAGLDLKDGTWEAIDFLKTVRNCIVHSAGDVSRSRDAAKLEQANERWPGFKIDDDTKSIVLQMEFSEFALKAAEQLFKEIFKEGGFGPTEPIRED